MAKKTTRKSDKAAPSPAPMTPGVPGTGGLVINPFGDTQQRKIVKSKVAVSTFKLSDGTRLLVTPVLSDVRRALKQFNVTGEPLYFLTLGTRITTKAPKRLMRPIPKSARKKKKAR